MATRRRAATEYPRQLGKNLDRLVGHTVAGEGLKGEGESIVRERWAAGETVEEADQAGDLRRGGRAEVAEERENDGSRWGSRAMAVGDGEEDGEGRNRVLLGLHRGEQVRIRVPPGGCSRHGMTEDCVGLSKGKANEDLIMGGRGEKLAQEVEKEICRAVTQSTLRRTKPGQSAGRQTTLLTLAD